MVYEAIEKENVPIYTYGPIIHNDEVVKDMEKKWRNRHKRSRWAFFSWKGCDDYPFTRYKQGWVWQDKKLCFEVLNATCPFVSKIHRYVEDYSSKGYDIIIVGSPKHPEVCGIKGWADEKCHVTIINSPEDAENYMKNSTKKLCIVSQTHLTTINFKI